MKVEKSQKNNFIEELLENFNNNFKTAPADTTHAVESVVINSQM